MDSDSWIRVILLAILTIGAAYCAACEISYASMNKIRVKSYADNGDKRAIKAMHISDNFDQALTTLLIGNNITHIAFGSLATLLASQLWGVESVKFVAVVSAVFIFLVSEMIPKSFAKANSEKFAIAASNSLNFLMRILSPVAVLFMSISKKISNLFPKADEPPITEEEFYDIIETAEEEGVLDKEKQELVHSVLNFDVITAGGIYTGRDKIVALDVNSPIEEILQVVRTQKYSRLPVYEGNIDSIIGILHVRKFLKSYLKQGKLDIRDLLTEVHFVREETPIDDLLRYMSNKKLHMSVVTDGFGRTLGIITIEDILEELVGEIWDEDDAVHEKHMESPNKHPETCNKFTESDTIAPVEELV